MYFDFLVSVPRALATLARNNSTLSALALVLGVVGGCMLSAWREQLRARKVPGAGRWSGGERQGRRSERQAWPRTGLHPAHRPDRLP